MASKQEIKHVLEFLRGSYIRLVRTWSDDDWDLTLRAYNATLSDLPYADLRRAAVHWASSSKWFPSVAELRSTVVQLRDPSMPTAEQAWVEADKLICRKLWFTPLPNGKTRMEYRDLQESDCSHALIWRTIQAMGLKAMRESDAPGVDRAHFRQFYNSFRDSAQAQGAMLPEIRAAVEGQRAERLPERAMRY